MMPDPVENVKQRLAEVANSLLPDKTASTIPWDPSCTKFPTRAELPQIPGAPKDAAWTWGPDDYLGRVNLLTPSRVAAASREIRTGEIIPVNLPLNVPDSPSFERETFEHKIKVLAKNLMYDDLYTLNTQAGTQWDGLRHCAHGPSKTFYNGTKGDDILGPNANEKASIHHWAEHGIAGRGVLLDYWSFAQKNGIKYDPYERYEISFDDLRKCAESQGLDFRPEAQGGHIKIGDILFIRSGFNYVYKMKTPEERKAMSVRPAGLGEDSATRFAGVEQEERMIDWLHDCYFAAVAGDSPTFEAWPSKSGTYLHWYILALWGMPLGEMLDLEKLSKRCAELNRWTFFFTSSPANVVRGVASHVNGMAIL